MPLQIVCGIVWKFWAVHVSFLKSSRSETHSRESISRPSSVMVPLGISRRSKGIGFSALVDVHSMVTRQSNLGQPATPCGRPLHSECRGDRCENSGRVRHEHNEIRNEIEGESTSLDQLPKGMISEKEAACNDKQEVDRDNSSAPSLVGSLARIWSGLVSYDAGVLKLQKDLKEKATRIDDLTKSLRAKDEELQDLEVKLKSARQENLDNLDILDAGRKEVQKLKSNIEETVKASKDAGFQADQLKAKCQKLGSQLALIEQKAAQESLTSGSYSDDRANPSMLEVACKAVDKTIDALAKVLYDISLSKNIPRDSAKFQHIIRQISPAHPADFSRAIQVRYVWSHWICYHMFRGFENVFIDFDEGPHTSPLDSKKHAMECFQSFQQTQSTSSSKLLSGCSNFRSFCSRKYQIVFPVELANWCLLPSGIVVVNEHGRFVGEGEIFDRFLDVAKAVWLLHELTFSFDPPTSILRMARGEPYDKQFHDSVVHVEDGDGSSAVVALMIGPAFPVRKSIVRSRVPLTQNLWGETMLDRPTFEVTKGKYHNR